MEASRPILALSFVVFGSNLDLNSNPIFGPNSYSYKMIKYVLKHKMETLIILQTLISSNPSHPPTLYLHTSSTKSPHESLLLNPSWRFQHELQYLNLLLLVIGLISIPVNWFICLKSFISKIILNVIFNFLNIGWNLFKLYIF